MPTKIINQIKNISPVFLNIILFIFTLFVALIIAFYQLFVDKNYRPLRIRTLLNINFWKQVKEIRKISQDCFNNFNSVIYNDNNFIKLLKPDNNEEKILTFLDKETLIEFPIINNLKNNLAFISQGSEAFLLNIYNLETHKLNKQLLDNKTINIGLINFDKLNNLYFFYQNPDNRWTIAVLKDDKVVPLIENISYNGSKLTFSAETIDNLIIYPQCNINCQLIKYNINNKQSENIDISSEDNSKEIRNINLLFYDEIADRIIYTLPERKIAFITDFKGYLWHHIYLELAEGNTLAINGILKDFNGNRKLLVYSKTRNQIYLYDINYIGLKTIDLKAGYSPINNQFNLPHNCLMENDSKSTFIRDMSNLKDKMLIEGRQWLMIY